MLISLSLAVILSVSVSLELESYLTRAIERGVTLFNAGNPEACAAVYATALEGVAANAEWGMDDESRANLTGWLEMSSAIPDPGEIEPWRVVLDGVMGGLSTGNLKLENERLIFTGGTSLRNNGGFSSIRARIPAGSLAGYNALRIQVVGDGRTYILGASSRSGRGDSYWTRFETNAGETTTVTAPISDMVRQFFGNPIQGRLQPGQVAGLEFYIYDGQEGPFRLEIERIEAVR